VLPVLLLSWLLVVLGNRLFPPAITGSSKDLPLPPMLLAGEAWRVPLWRLLPPMLLAGEAWRVPLWRLLPGPSPCLLALGHPWDSVCSTPGGRTLCSAVCRMRWLPTCAVGRRAPCKQKGVHVSGCIIINERVMLHLHLHARQ